MTDQLVILRKLVVLRDHVARARTRRPATVAELENDTLLQDGLAMSLLVAIQETVDIAFHVVADEAWGLPRSYAEAFSILADHDVIDQTLVEPLAGCARLRNRLAHGYSSVDVERIWNELPDGLRALDGFVEAIGRFVEERK